MISLGITPLDNIFDDIMTWISLHQLETTLILLSLALACLLGALWAKYRQVRENHRVSEALLNLARKKNETLHNLYNQEKGTPK